MMHQSLARRGRCRSPWRRSARPPTACEPRRPPTSRRRVDAAYAKYKDLKEGKNADYIPALAKVDPNLFGIARGHRRWQGLHAPAT